MNDNYLTVQEIAEKYRVTPAAVYKWIKEGRLKAIKLGRRIWRIAESALREFIDGGTDERWLEEKAWGGRNESR